MAAPTAVAEEHTDQPGAGESAHLPGHARRNSDYAAATAHYARSLAIRRALDDQLNVAAVLNNMAIVAQFEGTARSQHFHEEALAIRRKLGNRGILPCRSTTSAPRCSTGMSTLRRRPSISTRRSPSNAVGDKGPSPMRQQPGQRAPRPGRVRRLYNNSMPRAWR